jgi:hypothetical protein
MPTEDALPQVASRSLGSACPAQARLTASGAEPMANCGAVRARHHHGGTQLAAWPARLQGCRPSGLPPGHVAACSRRGRDRLVNRPDLAGQRAHVGARPDADLMSEQGNTAVASSGRQPHPDLLRQVPPTGSTVAMALRLGCARLLAEVVGARQQAKGGDTW